METAIVVVIMVVFVALAARSVYRTLTGKDEGCGCGLGPCPFSKPNQVDGGETPDNNPDAYRYREGRQMNNGGTLCNVPRAKRVRRAAEARVSSSEQKIFRAEVRHAEVYLPGTTTGRSARRADCKEASFTSAEVNNENSTPCKDCACMLRDVCVMAGVLSLAMALRMTGPARET